MLRYRLLTPVKLQGQKKNMIIYIPLTVSQTHHSNKHSSIIELHKNTIYLTVNQERNDE